MSPLSVLNFSQIGACISVLWWILQSVQNEEIEEKSEELKQNFAAHISEMAEAIFFSNLVCRLPFLASTSVVNLVPIG